MKYKDIMLYKENGKFRGLIKYTNSYQKELEHLKSINYLFASYIEKWPSYMDEDSQMQSYMIMDNTNKCYGGLFLYPSTANDKELIINYLMDKQHYNDKFNFQLFNSIIQSLSRYFYKYQSLSINLYNGIALEDYDHLNYEKKYAIATHSSYEYDNTKNYKKYSSLINNINDTAMNLKKQNIDYDIDSSWFSSRFNMGYMVDCLKNYKSGSINLEEFLYYVSRMYISFDNYESVYFDNDGSISIDNKRPNTHFYHLIYNVLSNDFEGVIYPTRDKDIDISKCSDYSDIKVHTKDYDIRIFDPENQNYKIMTYRSAKKNNSSNIVTMYVDDNNNILKLYVDYNIHKNAQDENRSKIKGIYTLRVDNVYNIYRISYISRSGYVYRYSFNSLEDYQHSLYDAVTSGILTLSNADDLIALVSYYFNQYNKDKINLSDENICQTVFDINEYVFRTLQNINLKNVVPNFKEEIDDFINNNQRKATTQKRLKI